MVSSVCDLNSIVNTMAVDIPCPEPFQSVAGRCRRSGLDLDPLYEKHKTPGDIQRALIFGFSPLFTQTSLKCEIAFAQIRDYLYCAAMFSLLVHMCSLLYENTTSKERF